MKFIHCSDLHLDSAMSTISQEASKIRKEEIISTFERLCEYACKNHVSAVIIAGDMFDNAKITLKVKNRVLNAITKTPQVDFIYLSGNHDRFGLIQEGQDCPSNLKLFDEQWAYFKYDNVVIAGVNINSLNSNSIYDSLSLNQNDVNIAVMHGQVVGFNSNEKAEIISIPRLKNKNIDYLALGHIHTFSQGEIDNRGKFCYSGCLEGRGFDETGEKGFVLLEVEGNKVKDTFFPFSTRNLFEVQFDVTGIENQFDLANELQDALVQNYSKDSLIKCVLVGERDENFEIEPDYILSKLKDSFFFFKIKDNTKVKINLDDYLGDKTVKGEFVRLVCEAEKDEQLKSPILLCGIRALKGEF